MSVYRNMKDKHKKCLWDRMHFDEMLNYILSRFEYDGLPSNLRPEDVEGVLIWNGKAGFGEKKGKLWAFPGDYTGEYIAYRGSRYKGVLPTIGDIEGKVYDGETGDIPVVWNNNTHSPELQLMQFSEILTEIDVSERINVLYSRLLKIPKLADSKEADTFRQTVKNIIDGKMDGWVSDNFMKTDIMEFLGVKDEQQFLELTDPQMIQYLQYLNQYHDNVMKRFWSRYGQSTQVTSKLAQMSPDEIHSNDNANLIYLQECLAQRQKGFELVNAKFGTNITVKLTDLFKRELDNAEGGETEDEEETVQDEGDSGEPSE